MSERKHHPFSPSTLQALAACPSYEGQQSFSEAAETGTKQHAVAESGQDDETLSDAQAEAVASAMDFVARQKQILEEARTKEVNSALVRLGGTVAEAEAAVPPVVAILERYLAVDDDVIYVPDTEGDHGEIGFVGTTGGFADAILISHDGKRAILVDHKFGKWPVPDAKENRQSDAYTLGVFHAYPTVESVQVFFFQPAVEGENKVTWVRSDVPELLLKIKTIVARAKLAREAGDFSTAAPHTPICLFCKHLAVCPKVAEKVIRAAKKFAPLLVPSDLTPTRVSEPAEAACGLRLVALVEAWAKAYKQLATDRALRGGPLPKGYELTSRATREVVNVERFREIALAFLTESEYLSSVPAPALTTIEKLISDKTPRGQKSQAVEAFQAAAEEANAVKKRAPYAFLRAETT